MNLCFVHHFRRVLAACFLVSAFFLSFSLTGPAQAEEPSDEAISQAEKGIDYLVELLGEKPESYDSGKLDSLVSLVKAGKESSEDVELEKRYKASGAYWEYVVNSPLSKIMQYAFNPAVPYYVAFPSVVRLGGWKDKQKAGTLLSGLWEKLPGIESPFIFKGVEYEQSTPGGSIGGYYSYEMDRLLLLFNSQGSDVLISVSKLKGPSGVGKKGTVIGKEREWNYFYSGIDGIMRKGLGWVDTYIYDSFSVYVFVSQPGGGSTKVGMFKWLRAGGSLIKNMVGESDIREGAETFSRVFKSVMEAKGLPAPEVITSYVKQVESLSDDELRNKLTPVAKLIEREAEKNSRLSRKEFAELISNSGYVKSLKREEMVSELVKRFLKENLNRSYIAPADPS